jgi:hypothetical protein
VVVPGSIFVFVHGVDGGASGELQRSVQHLVACSDAACVLVCGKLEIELGVVCALLTIPCRLPVNVQFATFALLVVFYARVVFSSDWDHHKARVVGIYVAINVLMNAFFVGVLLIRSVCIVSLMTVPWQCGPCWLCRRTTTTR